MDDYVRYLLRLSWPSAISATEECSSQVMRHGYACVLFAPQPTAKENKTMPGPKLNAVMPSFIPRSNSCGFPIWVTRRQASMHVLPSPSPPRYCAPGPCSGAHTGTASTATMTASAAVSVGRAGTANGGPAGTGMGTRMSASCFHAFGVVLNMRSTTASPPKYKVWFEPGKPQSTYTFSGLPVSTGISKTSLTPQND